MADGRGCRVSLDVIFFGGLALLVALLVGMRLGLRLAMRGADEEAFEAEARCAQVRADAQAVVRQVCAEADEIVRQERAKAREHMAQALAILEEAKRLNAEVFGKTQQRPIRPQGGVQWGRN
jgi:hypothetical protein